MIADERAELNELLAALREDALDAAQHARLSELLAQDAEARRQYVEYMAVVAALHKYDVSAFAPRSVERRRGRWAAAAVSAAALIALAVLLQHSVPANPGTADPGFVAALTGGTDMRWRDTDPHYLIGQKMAAGRCRLDGGVALITFESGATAILQAPAELELVTKNNAFLHSGQVFVRASNLKDGFKLETPTARLLDLGTEFGVSVNASGDALLQVYEGEVLAELKNTESKDGQRVTGGQAVGMTSNFKNESFWPERFIRTLPDKNDPAGRGFYAYNASRYTEIDVLPASQVRIDGELSDWDLSGQIHAACEPPYGENYYLHAAMMYDAENLYIAGHVGDPFAMRSQVSPHVTRELYGMGGGIALRISTDRKAGWPLHAESQFTKQKKPLTADDTNDKLNFLMLWFYQPENLACLQIKHGMDLHSPRVNPEGYEGAWRKDADGKGYIVEYRISWKLLGAEADPPRAGDTLAACWLAHWSDALGETWKGQLIDVLKPGEAGWNFDRAATWGKAIYRGANAGGAHEDRKTNR
jgi:hypothetical protein